MIISRDNYPIRYPGHHYPVQPYIQDHPIADHEHQQAAIEENKFFRRPASETTANDHYFNNSSMLYDFKLFLQYPALDQVGLLVDIYA